MGSGHQVATPSTTNQPSPRSATRVPITPADRPSLPYHRSRRSATNAHPYRPTQYLDSGHEKRYKKMAALAYDGKKGKVTTPKNKSHSTNHLSFLSIECLSSSSWIRMSGAVREGGNGGLVTAHVIAGKHEQSQKQRLDWLSAFMEAPQQLDCLPIHDTRDLSISFLEGGSMTQTRGNLISRRNSMVICFGRK